MIIVGYPGIGKSTLCQYRDNCIDLESSCFDKLNKNWYKDYCNVAVDLHKQGNIALVSNHESVYEELSSKNELPKLNDYFVYLMYIMKNEMWKLVNKKYIAKGTIKGKMEDSPYYCIVLEDNTKKYLLSNRIIGNHTKGMKGILYYISSVSVSYYQFEVIEWVGKTITITKVFF